MGDIYSLQNQIKHYEWGSYNYIPDFLGIENLNGQPFAEMWMGTHDSAPSQAFIGGRLVDLKEISGGLPFLFKLLAVDKPLSVQVHPDKKQAEEGFLKEEELGISLTNPKRNYKDNNHKPEILCALTPFTLMAGFKEPSAILKSLKELLIASPKLKEVNAALIHALEKESLRGFFNVLHGMSRSECECFNSFFLNNEPEHSNSVISPLEWALMKQFASQYPCDPAIISPLYLNHITLQSGQAVFLPAGILHAHLSGFGIELMASSDNVLRGGLTAKHIDIKELSNILSFAPFMPQVISSSSSEVFCYYTQKDEFSLCFVKNSGGAKTYTKQGASICLVTEGELQICGRKFTKGQSLYINKKTYEEPVVLEGNFSLYAASDSVMQIK